MQTKTHAGRYPALLLAVLGVALGWQAPARAASRHNLPVVMGPDATTLSSKPAGPPTADAGQPGSSGPRVMYVGNSPLHRAVHSKAGRRAGRSARHAHERLANLSR